MNTINHDPSPAPDDPTRASTLDEVLTDPDRGGGPVAVTLTWSGHRTIVLGRADNDQVRMAPGTDRAVLTVSDSVSARPITDPTEQLATYQSAVAQLTTELDARDRQLRDVADRHDALLQKVDEIRQYAIDRHRDGDFCRNGLNRFFAQFNLAPYAPQTRVRYTIVGSYLVDHDDPSVAAHYARRQLAIDFDAVDDFIEGSDDEPTVTADAATE